MRSLTLVSGVAWPLSPRARQWFAREPKFVRMDVEAPGSDGLRRRFDALPAGAGECDLAAIADDGRMWRGPSAWVMALWALEAHRRTAVELSRTGRHREARRIVEGLSRSLCFVPPRGAASPRPRERSDSERAARAAVPNDELPPWRSALRVLALPFFVVAGFLLLVDLAIFSRGEFTRAFGAPLAAIGWILVAIARSKEKHARALARLGSPMRRARFDDQTGRPTA